MFCSPNFVWFCFSVEKGRMFVQTTSLLGRVQESLTSSSLFKSVLLFHLILLDFDSKKIIASMMLVYFNTVSKVHSTD